MKINPHTRWLAMGFAVVICLFALSGCEEQADDAAVPVRDSEKNTFITCFGMVQWRENQTLTFPFDCPIRNIQARDGQIVSTQDVLFRVDYDELLLQKAILTNEMESLKDTRSGYESELAQLRGELAVCQAGASGYDPHAVMDVLKSIAQNKSRTSKRNQYRLELIEYLNRYGLLGYYDDLLDDAMAGDKFYYENINPLLEQIDQNFAAELLQLKGQCGAKSAQLKQADAECLLVQEKVDAINGLLAGGSYQNVKLSANGEITIANSGYLVDTVYAKPNETIPSNEPILNLAAMNSLEVICYVEEQLVGDIQVGNHVQLALYSDSTVIEIGTVEFIAQKAIQRNGETVVEIAISYEGDSFLPGYNIVAKVMPVESK